MTWRSSSYSGTDGNCVQIRGDLAAIRDSKNPTGPNLSINLPNLVTAVKTGRLQVQ
ncbi:DUF397 domain-containing protein [Actinophytocola sediminis]